MRAANASNVVWAEVSGHRDGTIESERVLVGRVGTKENFELALTRTIGRILWMVLPKVALS
jgi:hypothetical protein